MASPKTQLTNDQKREWAQVLYVQQRLSQKEIAEKVGSSEKTVGTWKEKYGWDALRKSLLVTKQEILRRWYNQIEALTLAIENRKEPFPTNGESQTMNNIAASIEKLETETSIKEIFEVGTQFLDFVRSQDLDKAKEISGYYDAFIQNALK